MEMVITVSLVIMATVYTVWHIIRTLRQGEHSDKCMHCALKKIFEEGKKP